MLLDFKFEKDNFELVNKYTLYRSLNIFHFKIEYQRIKNFKPIFADIFLNIF